MNQLVPAQSAPMLMPAPAQWTQMMQMGDTLLKSGFLPTSIKTPAQAVAIMLKGWEMGVPAMQAFAQISVIQGKPAVGAELMLARIYDRFPNADIQVVKRDAEGCHIKARRDKKAAYVDFKFEVEDAKRADLMGKDNWRKWPKNMFYWRAVSDMARAMWPECLAGASHTPEELGAVVDEQGEIVDVPATPAPEPAPVAQIAPKKKTPSPIYDNENADEQAALAAVLTKKKVDPSFHEAVGLGLHGHDKKELDNVIAIVIAQAAKI